MEDVKWLLRRCGLPILLLLILVIVGVFCWRKMHAEKQKVVEEVWEPPVEIENSDAETEEVENTETSTDSAYWFIPQASDDLLSEEEKEQLQSTVLSAAESVKKIYKDIVIADAPSYSSGINEFTNEQRKAVVEQLGRSGLVSIGEDSAMQNHEAIEVFYADYLNGQDSMVTVFEVQRDGLIGAVTFIYRKEQLQVYYIGVRWKEGGMPEIQGTSVSNVAEIKLTEKGYFKHTSFFTDEDGDLILPEALKIGNYRIEEIKAPFGYVVNDNYINISVDTDTAFETDGDTNDAIITVEYSDAPAVGELTVEKKGEVLDGFKGGLFANSEDKEFVYKEGSLAGAVFKVYAAEDIFTADKQKDADGNRTKYYSKGDLVATLTTGKDGKAVAKNLPLGQYKVVEVTAPDGYVLNPNEQTVTFTYVDDKTPVIKESLTFSNDRQKLDMSVTKLDSEDNTPIAGAVFGLYADEDIKNVDGKVIIEKGTLLEKATSDENGKITFVKDYPFAKYVAKEIEKPAGYVTNEEVVTFDTKYQGQDVKTAVYSSEYKNTPTTFEFTKTDITSGAELSGATLTVLDKDGNVVDTWTSDAKEAHVIKKLVVGETYTLREEFAPYGYLKATDIQFTVEDTGDVQHVEMKDEVPTGSIVINKDGEFVTDTTLMKGHWYDFIFNYFKDSLAGVTFDVYQGD